MASSSSTELAPRTLVLVVEDEVLVRFDIAAMLETAGYGVIPVVSAEEALEVLASTPDIKALVTDVSLSAKGMNGFELARRVRDQWGIGAVVLSARAAPDEGELPPGARYLAKPVHQDTLVFLVDDLARSEPEPRTAGSLVESGAESEQALELTPRQRDVLTLLAEGRSNRDIALALGLSEHTVKVHVTALFRTLGVSNRVEAALAARRQSRSDLSSELDRPAG